MEFATFWAGYIFWPRNNFNKSGENYIKDQIIKIYDTHIFINSLIELFFTTRAMQISRKLGLKLIELFKFNCLDKNPGKHL